MDDESSPHSPRVVVPLAYETAPIGKSYQRLCLPAGLVYFPDVCCDCLMPTQTLYTVVGNRERHRSLTGTLVAGAVETRDHFELKVRICNRCWNAYLRRRNSWFWLGPLCGAGVGLVLGGLMIVDIFQRHEMEASVWGMGVMFIFAGLLAGLALNGNLADCFAKPPAKVRRLALSNRIAIRFRSPAYNELFLRAQTQIPQREKSLRMAQVATSMDWYYLKDGRLAGPVDFQALRQRCADGLLQPEDRIWAQNEANWIEARTIPGLFDA